MIRLRVEQLKDHEVRNGVMWYVNGYPVGRVVIEELRITEDLGDPTLTHKQEWVPVEVVE